VKWRMCAKLYALLVAIRISDSAALFTICGSDLIWTTTSIQNWIQLKKFKFLTNAFCKEFFWFFNYIFFSIMTQAEYETLLT
jgi:hypothetical protein